jgi:hypothetical protein
MFGIKASSFDSPDLDPAEYLFADLEMRDPRCRDGDAFTRLRITAYAGNPTACRKNAEPSDFYAATIHETAAATSWAVHAGLSWASTRHRSRFVIVAFPHESLISLSCAAQCLRTQSRAIPMIAAVICDAMIT